MKGLLLIGLFLIGCSDNFEPTPDCNDCGWSQHLQWETDYQYQIVEGQWTSLVNPGSMTDENGNAHVMFSAWEDFIGYTVTVYCGYTDECGVHYLDSIKIKVVDEE